MAFDGAGFEPWPRREEPPPRPSAQTRILCYAGVAFALAMLIFPISVDGLIDLARYLWGR